MTKVNAAADPAEDEFRVSIEAKATVKIGPFSRRGVSRVAVKAADHDFEAEATVTPVGFFLPQQDELSVYDVPSTVTSDCLVDQLERWWVTVQPRFAPITRLVITLDNGPENHSRRTQFMDRVVEFAQTSRLSLRLASYPP